MAKKNSPRNPSSDQFKPLILQYKSLRKRAGVTQAQAAITLQVSLSTFKSIESFRRCIKLHEAERLKDAIDVLESRISSLTKS